MTQNKSRIDYSILTERTNLRTIITSIIIASIGILLLYWSNLAGGWPTNPAVKATIRDLGSLCIVSVGVALIWELYAKRAFVDEIYAKTDVSKELYSAGLLQVAYDAHDINWNQLFESATEIDLHISYGRNWFSTHHQKLAAFVAKPNTKLRVVLSDPDSVAVINGLASRVFLTPEQLAARINESIDNYCELGRQGKNIEIWLSKTPPTVAIYRFDNVIIISVYTYQEKWKNLGVPHFVVANNGSLFAFFRSDFETLIRPERGLSRKLEV